MATNDQLLASDYKKVVETLRLYKNINLIRVSGEPAEEYDIEYTIRGFTKGLDGKIKIVKRHRIKFQLPFGYPHFPPTVKPLTPIFHPDIDDPAIRIADYWEENKSLPQLILHIGEMLCGKVYSIDNPFNQEAADYYEKNKKHLPLDALLPLKEEKTTITEKLPSFELHIPVAKIFFSLLFLAAVSCGSLYFFEKMKLEKVGTTFTRAQTHKEDQEYKKAQSTAQEALDDLGTFYLLRASGQTLQAQIQSFIQSKAIQEGIKGKINYEGKYIDIDLVHKLEMIASLESKAAKYEEENELDKAVEAYEKALSYTGEGGLENKNKELRQKSAQLKLQLYIASAEKAHKNKLWSQAIALHKKVLNFIKEEKSYLDATAAKQAARANYLLMLDQIALYSQQASEAEAMDDLETALQNYNELIDYIGKSGSQDNTTLKDTLLESMQKAAIITEKLNIRSKQAWLLENYKDIFIKHYPSSIPGALSSPQAIFVRYEGNNLVFDLSCLEKGSGSVARLRLFYQFNPDLQQWTIFTGEIE